MVSSLTAVKTILLDARFLTSQAVPHRPAMARLNDKLCADSSPLTNVLEFFGSSAHGPRAPCTGTACSANCQRMPVEAARSGRRQTAMESEELTRIVEEHGHEAHL